MEGLGSQYRTPKCLKKLKTLGLKIDSNVNNSLGFAKAGVPVNKITCFAHFNIGVSTFVLLAKKFFK